MNFSVDYFNLVWTTHDGHRHYTDSCSGGPVGGKVKIGDGEWMDKDPGLTARGEVNEYDDLSPEMKDLLHCQDFAVNENDPKYIRLTFIKQKTDLDGLSSEKGYTVVMAFDNEMQKVKFFKEANLEHILHTNYIK